MCHDYVLTSLAILILLQSTEESWQPGPSLRTNLKEKLLLTHQFLAKKLDTPVVCFTFLPTVEPRSLSSIH